MKFYIQKLGCPKNDVDADYIAARLIADGHLPAKGPQEADTVLVNTCGFILPAKEESIHELLSLGQLKKAGTVKTLYATGCLSQRHGDELLKDMPELDGAFGIGELDAIAAAVAGSEKLEKTVLTEPRRLGYLDWHNRFIDDGWPFAYLKISDGCDRRCSYCAIPDIRGDYRSRPMESILSEAAFLAENGKKEIILVSQDATLFGRNSKDSKANLIGLLKELDGIDGIEWIRLLYLHPAGVTDELIEYVAGDNKTLKYFDLPLQHISSPILASMHRHADGVHIRSLIGRIRSVIPQAAVRTTFIVGLPGETEVRFEELKEFVAETRFDRMGVFAYSEEEGTAAAGMTDQVAHEVKYRRLDQLMTLQQGIAFEKNNSLIGKTTDVIIDEIFKDGSGRGRTYADCPEIDQEVLVSGATMRTGDICRVSITAARGYDLEGIVAEG